MLSKPFEGPFKLIIELSFQFEAINFQLNYGDSFEFPVSCTMLTAARGLSVSSYSNINKTRMNSRHAATQETSGSCLRETPSTNLLDR